MKKGRIRELLATYILTANKSFKIHPKIYPQVCFILILFSGKGFSFCSTNVLCTLIVYVVQLFLDPSLL